MFGSLCAKPVHRVVGMMSGTSVDGVDAALVEITRAGGAPKVKLLAFENLPYPADVRPRVFELFRPETSTVDRIGYMNFLLGELYARAALRVIEKAGLTRADVDLIGSHGQTICTSRGADARRLSHPLYRADRRGRGHRRAQPASPRCPISAWRTWPWAGRARRWCPFPSICSIAARMRASSCKTSAASAT